MIISHKFRFIYIKTVKTAGTSIEVYLSPHCGEGDVLTPILPVEEGHRPRNFGRYYHHFSAWGIRETVAPEIWSGYFKFCVERNPWDKTISDYAMAQERAGGELCFEQYLEARRYCKSWELYTDTDNRTLLVDRVLRYENLDEELGDVFRTLGVPWSGSLGVRAKSGYRKDRRHYRDWYSEAQRDQVAEAFADEIREFGYEF